jgi:exodeoxyribonuclease VII large subunit
VIPPDPAHVMSVTALATQAKELLEAAFTDVWVSGEISNFTKAASGHMYLTLKDSAAQLKCVFFRGSNLRLRFDPQDGLEVLAKGQISLYPARGDIQFYIQELQPKGLGAAELALRQLKEKLFAKGYFDPKRKRPLPRFPRRVALIASPCTRLGRTITSAMGHRWASSSIMSRIAAPVGEAISATRRGNRGSGRFRFGSK